MSKSKPELHLNKIKNINLNNFMKTKLCGSKIKNGH